MTDEDSVAERLEQLTELEESRLFAYFNKYVGKAQQKAWHDQHIRTKSLAKGDLVILY